MKLLLLMLFVPSILSAQRVQLSGIPGQDSDMDITDMLEQIMYPYHNDITNLNNNRIDQEIRFELWQEFRSNVQNFEQINRYIMGYESSFRSLTNEISDPTALSVQTLRSAKKGDYRITIYDLATAHSFASAPISTDEVITGGMFDIIISSNTNTINFKEGSITDLYQVLRDTLSNDIDVRLLNSSATKKIISMVSKKEGVEHEVSFDGDIAPLLQTKFLTRGEESTTNLSWSALSNATISNTSKAMETSYPIEMPTMMSFSAVLSDMPIAEVDDTKVALSTLSSSEIGGVSSFDVVLPGATPILDDIIEDISEPVLPVQNITLLFDDDTEEVIDLESKQFSVDLEQFKGKTLVNIIALSEKKILEISDFTLTATPNGELSLYNETVKAKDASFLLDGVEFNRPSNVVSDLISGVTLELQQENKTNVLVKIKPDTELIKDTVIQWVMNYNTIMEEIHTFTTIPLSQIGKLKPLHEREADGDDLKEGTFYGNSTLINFKDRMRRMIGSTQNHNELSLLDQVGIYVRRRTAPNSDPDAIRKGTLSFDLAEFEKILNEDFDSVYHLFSMDTTGNSIGDMGVSVNSLNVLQLMIGEHGYLTRMEQDNSRILKEMDEQIAKKEDEVDRVTRRERQSLLEMSQAVSQSKALSESMRQRIGY